MPPCGSVLSSSPGGAGSGAAVQPCLISGVCVRKHPPSMDDLCFGGCEELDMEESDSSEVQAMNQVCLCVRACVCVCVPYQEKEKRASG